MRVEHAATGLTLLAAIDDLWADAGEGCTTWSTTSPPRRAARWGSASTGRAATGAKSSFTSGSCADRGLEVSGRAWLVDAYGIRDGEAFDDVLHFRTRVIPYDGGDAWV